MTGAANKAETLGQELTSMLTTELRNLLSALGERATREIAERIGGLTDSLTSFAGEKGTPGGAALAAGLSGLAGGKSPVRAAVGAAAAGVKERIRNAFGGSDGMSAEDRKVTNIYEVVDVGVPVRVAYDQWTRFQDFPSFMKKVENVEQASEEKLTWQAQIFLSHRQWESTILDQVPDSHIIWRSQGEKGFVDGTVTFHALTPDLTRIVLVLEYHPRGFFEKTGNLWRAQGRRVRLELKHFVRHVMTRTILEQDQLQGWRGEIRDGEVVRDHESEVEDPPSLTPRRPARRAR